MKLGKKLIALVTVFIMLFGSIPLTGLADADHPYYYDGALSYSSSVKDGKGDWHNTSLVTLEKDGSTDSFPAYCCDLYHWLHEEHFATAPLTDGHIRAIVYANTGDIIASAGLTPDKVSSKQMTAAIQAAIWHFSDGMSLSDDNDATVKALYAKLIALSSAGARGDESVATVSVELVSYDGYNSSGRVTLTFRYKCSDSSVTLTPAVSGGNGTLGTPTAKDGWRYVAVSNINPANPFKFSASGSQTVSYDARLYIPENSADQKLVGLPHTECVKVSASMAMQFGALRIRKIFDGSADNAEGFTVTVTGTGSVAGVSRTVTVNSNATNNNWVTVSGLPFGTYVITETLSDGQKVLFQNISIVNNKTGDNTVVIGDTTDITATCTDGEESYGDVTVTNRKVGSLELRKAVDSESSVEGVTFHFTVTGPNDYKKELDLANGGSQTLGGLLYGTYKITEDAKDNFRLTGFSGGGGTRSGSTYTLTIGDGNRSVVVTANNQKLGQIEILKTDSHTGKPVAGVTFHIAGPDFTGDKTTGDSGRIVIGGLTPGGSYTVTETDAPADYKKDAGSHPAQTIKAGGTATFSFEDTPVGVIKVIKQDPADSSVKLSGVTFKVSKNKDDFSDANIVATLTTGSDGTATSGKIETGFYWIKEINPPDGYVNDNADPVKIEVKQSSTPTAANTFTFSDRKNVGSLLIKKVSAYDDTTPVAGAQFEVSRNADFTDLVASLPNGGKTDDKGELLVTNLKPGSYWVREVAAAPGYTFDIKVVNNVTVKFNEQAVTTFSNTPVGYVKIIKKDAYDNGALAGAVFGIYRDAACTDLIETLKATDKDGLAISSALPFGPSTVYYVKEISAPARYDADPRTLQAAFTKAGEIKELTFKDERKFGDLKVKKALEGAPGDTTSFKFKITGPSYPDGREFQLSANEETPFYGLTFGTYVITELDVPAGYKLESMSGGGGTWDGTSYTVVLGKANQGFTVTAANRKLGSIDIKKKLLDGVTLDATKFDFTISGPGFSSPQSFSLASGENKSFGNLEYGKYTITEQPCPDGYAFASFSGGGGTASGRTWTVTLGSSNLNIEVTCSNRKLGHLEVIKTKAGSTPVVYLAGAVFGIYSDEACKNLVETMTATDANGKAISGWLTPGDYWVKEISAPDGYGIDSAPPVKATVAPGETNILPAFTDTQLLGRATFSKVVDNATDDPAEFTLKITGDNGYSNTVKVGEKLAPVTLSDLPFGHYTVTEDAKDGYQKVTIVNGTFTIEKSNYAGAPVQVVAKNHKLLGSAVFSKDVDNVTDDPAEFTLRITGDNGYSNTVKVGEKLSPVTLTDLPFGHYTVTEDAAYGYSNTGITHSTFTIDATNYSAPAVQVKATNHKLFGKAVFKKDVNNVDDDPAEFTLKITGDNGYSNTVTVGEKLAPVTLSDLPFGHYTVTETAKTGYQNVEITNGTFTVDFASYEKTVTVTAVNHKLLGTVVLSKVVDNIESDPKEFTLHITGDNGYSNTVKVGEKLAPVTLDKLPFGHYTVTEDAVTGYETVEIKNGTFTIDATTYNAAAIEVVAKNHKLLGSAVFSKVVDNDAGDTAKFTLTVKGDNGYSGTVTVGQGLAAVTLNSLPFGHYTVTEEAADGYETVEIENSTFTIDATNYTAPAVKVVAKNHKLFGSAVFKKDVNNVENDATEFTLKITGDNGYSNTVKVGEKLAPVTLDKLPFGHYTVTEDAKDGYQKVNIVNGSFTVSATTYKAAITVTAVNHRLLGRIKVVKTDAASSGTYLKGAEFKISTSNASPDDFNAHVVDTITTGDDGVAMSKYLPLGTYYVKETKAPAGYDAASGDAQTVSVGDTDTTYTVNFKDNKLHGSAVFAKVIDNDDKDPKTFTLRITGDNGYSNTVTVGQTIAPKTLSDLPFGHYTVTEDAVDGYETVGIDNATFTIDATTYSAAVAVTAHNCVLLGAASFSKQVSNVDDDATEFTLKITGDNGYSNTVKVGEKLAPAALNNLPLGHYTVTEDAKDGYKLDSITPSSFDVKADNLKTVTAVKVVNSKLFGSASFSKQVSNVENDATEFTLKVTGDNGYSNTVKVGEKLAPAVLNDLPLGHYTVTEDAKDGYKLDSITPSSFDVKAGSLATVTAVQVVNSKLLGAASFSKQVSNVDNDATEFTLKITGDNGYSNTVKVGEKLAPAVLNGLPFGHYTVTEDAKDGYKLDSITPASFDVKADNLTTVTSVAVVNSKLLGAASFSKQVSNVDNDATEFTLKVTGDNGYSNTVKVGEKLAPVVLSDLPLGHYTVTEDAKDGYKLGSITPSSFDVKADNLATVTAVLVVNSKLFGSATFSKVVDNDAADDATFTLKVTGDNGYANTVTVGQALAPVTLSGLPFGHYTVAEDALDGYTTVGILNEHFTVDGTSYAGAPVQVVATNHKQMGRISAVKIDSKNSGLYLGGAVFSISTQSGAGFDSHIVATMTTDAATGIAVSKLLPKGTYWVKETTAPAGYVIDDTAAREAPVSDGETYHVPVFKDTKYEGSLLIRKVTTYDHKSPVAGAQFQVATDAAFTHLVALPNGGRTDAKGELLVQHLVPETTYWVREVDPAPGYDIDRTLTQHVAVIFNDVVTVTFENTPLGRVQVMKLDSADRAVKLAGAVFGIYSDAECKNIVVTMPATDGNGLALSGELPFGPSTVYYVKEITPPAGYLKDDGIQPATFTTAGQVVALTFTDVKEVGSLVVKKVNALNRNQTLAGAEFRLYSDEALKHQVGAAVTTGADGLARFDNLTPGTYWVKETKAPKDYDLFPDAISAEVKAGETNPEPLVFTDTYNPPQDYQTGMMDWNILLIGGLALLAGIVVVLFTRKHRRAGKHAR